MSISVRVYKERLRAKRRKRRIIKTAVNFLLFFAVIALSLYALFFAGLFEVTSVVIDTPDTIPKPALESVINQWLEKRILGIKRASNPYIFSPKGIEGLLMDSFPRIKSVSISRTPLHVLHFTLSSRAPAGLWCLTKQDRCYLFDINGIAFAEIQKSSGFVFLSIFDKRERAIGLKEKVEDKKWIDNILMAKRVLQFGGIRVSSFEIAEDSMDEFIVNTADGWEIWFSNSANVSRQGDALIQFLKEKITPEELAELEYINLTIPDRIYYK